MQNQQTINSNLERLRTYFEEEHKRLNYYDKLRTVALTVGASGLGNAFRLGTYYFRTPHFSSQIQMPPFVQQELAPEDMVWIGFSSGAIGGIAMATAMYCTIERNLDSEQHYQEHFSSFSGFMAQTYIQDFLDQCRRNYYQVSIIEKKMTQFNVASDKYFDMKVQLAYEVLENLTDVMIEAGIKQRKVPEESYLNSIKNFVYGTTSRLFSRTSAAEGQAVSRHEQDAISRLEV